MSKVKATLESLFGTGKVRKTPQGYRANAEEITLDALCSLSELEVEDLKVKRSGTGVVVIVDL